MIVKVGDKERAARARGKDVKLSPKEYELLRVLVQHSGRCWTHKFLLGELWDKLTIIDAQYLRVLCARGGKGSRPTPNARNTS